MYVRIYAVNPACMSYGRVLKSFLSYVVACFSKFKVSHKIKKNVVCVA